MVIACRGSHEAVPWNGKNPLPSPKTRASLKSPSAAKPAEIAAAALSPASVPAKSLAAAVLLVLLVLFYANQPLRLQLWLFLLNPDLLVGQWFGSGQMAIGILDRASLLLNGGIILLCMIGLGHLVLGTIGAATSISRSEQLIIAALLGYGVVSCVVLLMGLIATSASALVLGITLALMILLAAPIRKLYSNKPTGDPSASPLPTTLPDSRTIPTAIPLAQNFWSWSERSLAIVISLFVVCTLWASILPPHDFDVREYHLQVPKEWYRSGQISFLPHNVYGNMPLLAEAPTILAMNLWRSDLDWWYGALTGKLLMAFASTLAAGSVYFIARRLSLGRLSSLIATAIYVSHPWVLHVSIGGLNDGVLASFAILTLHALLLDASITKRAIFAGLSAGMACCCKYPALALVLFPALVWLVRDALLVKHSTKDIKHFLGDYSLAEWRTAAMSIAIFLAATLVTIGPWYGKNVYFTGNPVYPLAGSFFGTPPLDDEAIGRWERAHQVPRDANGYRYTPAQLASSLWRAFVAGEYASAALPLFAIGIFFALRTAGHERAIAIWMLWGLAVWWLLSHRLDRFLLPMLPLAALLAGIACEKLLSIFAIAPSLHYSQKRSWCAIALLTILLVDGALVLATPLAADNRWFVSLEALRVDAIQGDDPSFPRRVRESHTILNQLLPRDKLGVLLVGDAAPFDIERECSYNVCFNPCLLCEWTIGKTDDEIREAFSSRSIRYVLVDWGEIARYQSKGNYGYDPRFTPQLVEDLVQRKIIEPIALETPADGHKRSFSLFQLPGPPQTQSP